MIHLRKTVACLCLLLFCVTFNWAAKIELTPSEELEKEGKGYLYIATRPPDADIYVDGELLGKTSEKGGIFGLQVSKVVGIEREVSAGNDTIRISDASPFTTGDTIVIAGIGKSEIARIKEISEMGITLIQPLKNDYNSNAKVYRRRIVRIQKKFYQPKRIDVLIIEGEITRIPFTRLLRGQTRALTIISDPLKAFVYINDELQFPLSHLVTGTGNSSVKEGRILVQVKDVSPFEVGEIVTLDDDDTESIKAMIEGIDKLKNIITLRVSKDKTIEPNMFTAEQNGYIKSVSPFKTPCTLRDIKAGKYKVKLVSEDKKKVWQDEIELNVGEAEIIDTTLMKDNLSPVVDDPPFLINGGDKVTPSRIVTLSFNAHDETEVAELLISNDGQNWAAVKYAPKLKWKLLPHPDEKRVQVKFRDHGGNETRVYTAEIRLISPYGMQYIKEENSFYIDKYEVTNAQYKKFIDETGYKIPEHWNKEYKTYPKGTANHPVVNVSWKDADRYTKWLGNRLQRECRIPTEEQWLRAAKGSDKYRKWPWGNLWKGTITNFVNWKTGSGIAPVNEFSEARSEYGVYNMAGNVWEWIAKPEDYAEPSAIEILTGRLPEIKRRIRGGIKIDEDGEVTILDDSYYEDVLSDHGYKGVGFRCVIPIED